MKSERYTDEFAAEVARLVTSARPEENKEEQAVLQPLDEPAEDFDPDSQYPTFPDQEVQASEPKAMQAPVAKVVRTPKQPTDLEKAQHAATHLPMATWCDHCVRGKAKEDVHGQVEADPKADLDLV